MRLSTSTCLLLLLATPAAAQHLLYEHLGGTTDRLGEAVAGLGDIDGDGVGDYAVGRPGYDYITGFDIGRIDVYSGATATLIRYHLGTSSGDELGASIDALGDVDGDGIGDYIAGAPGADSPLATDCGRVYRYSGADGSGLGNIVFAQDGAHMGMAVRGTGDLDGDGVPDYAIGIPYADDTLGGLNDAGLVLVRSGASPAALWTFKGSEAGAFVGFSLDTVGDVDGDGRNELVVGAPGHDLGGNPNVGRAFVLDGQSGSLVAWRFGGAAGEQLGYSVAGVGDMNLDGMPDMALGSPFSNAGGSGSGHVVVCSASSPSLVVNVLDGPANSQAGIALAGVGDVDGDGRPDLAVGMPSAGLFSLSHVGWVWIVSGKTGSPIETLIGSDSGDKLGESVAGVGDLNGDGFADVIAGGPDSDVAGGNAGIVRLWLGNVDYSSRYCTAKVNSAGCTPRIDWSGTPSVSIADDFHVTASDVLQGKLGILIWSPTPASTPFGGGTLCVAAPIHRTALQSSGGSASQPCSGSYDFHFSHAYMASQSLAPGVTIHAQYWSRDPGYAPPGNVGLTDAVAFTLLD